MDPVLLMQNFPRVPVGDTKKIIFGSINRILFPSFLFPLVRLRVHVAGRFIPVVFVTMTLRITLLTESSLKNLFVQSATRAKRSRQIARTVESASANTLASRAISLTTMIQKTSITASIAEFVVLEGGIDFSTAKLATCVSQCS